MQLAAYYLHYLGIAIVAMDAIVAPDAASMNAIVASVAASGASLRLLMPLSPRVCIGAFAGHAMLPRTPGTHLPSHSDVHICHFAPEVTSGCTFEARYCAYRHSGRWLPPCSLLT